MTLYSCGRGNMADSRYSGAEHGGNTAVDIPLKNSSQVKAKPYTIMIYMNGSDLESENGAATSDLTEMLDANIDEATANIVIFTGGTNRWHNNVVPSNDCVIWRISEGGIEKIESVGLRSMGESETLSGFISYAIENFPADKYGLIFWDHGGGSIAGYGHDEKFENSRLTLPEMRQAFEDAGLSENKLEFLGYDACLMATVETAVMASPYARYLVASEDLEPGDGWDYNFLSSLNTFPEMDGAALGMVISDRYMDYYGQNSGESLTISVTKLSNAAQVMDAMGNLMSRCTRSLLEDREASFAVLAGRRRRTKSFGDGSRRDNDCDMVDIADMAQKLSDLFPDEAASVSGALNRAVIYNRSNSDIALGGLTAYYIYGGKDDAEYTLQAYDTLDMDQSYTGYLNYFAGFLKGGSRQINRTPTDAQSDMEAADVFLTAWKPVPGQTGAYYMAGLRGYGKTYDDHHRGLWPVINGNPVCMDKTGSFNHGFEYSVPVTVNNQSADLVVLIDNEHPDGKIAGIRHEEGYIIQKGVDPINDGDVIVFHYKVKRPDDIYANPDAWYQGEPITVNGGLELDWAELEQPCLYSVLSIDYSLVESFSGFAESSDSLPE